MPKKSAARTSRPDNDHHEDATVASRDATQTAVMPRPRKPRGKGRRSQKETPLPETIVIDSRNNLAFETEKEVYAFFTPSIEKLLEELRARRRDRDVPLQDVEKFTPYVQGTLKQPDEVWELEPVEVNGESLPVASFVAKFTDATYPQGLFYVVLAYMVEGEPRFVYLHFPTQDEKLYNAYRRGKILYQRSHDLGESLGHDALSEGDELAKGLYSAMLKIRSSRDVPEDEFPSYHGYRQSTLEEPDEIWRYSDPSGNVLVVFIKAISQNGISLYHLAVTLEEAMAETHSLLFSFPTRDMSLVERYRRGESLSQQSFVPEESH